MASMIDLPHNVLRRIMESLNMKDIARFMFSSKKVREAGEGLLELRVNSSDLSIDNNARSRKLFCQFFTAYMRDRDGRQLNFFSLDWGFFVRNAGEQDLITGWIEQAVKCNVRAMILDFRRGPVNGWPFLLPQFLYHHQSLTCFAFRRGIMASLPDTGCFSGLKCFELEQVYARHLLFGEWISSSCKKLEELMLCEIGGVYNLDINIPSLQLLTLTTAVGHAQISIFAENLQFLNLSFCNSPLKGSLTVYAPSLKGITLDGYFPRHCNLNNFTELQGAQIFIRYDANPDTYQPSLDRVLRYLEQTLHLSLTARFLEFILVGNYQAEILQKVQKFTLHLHRRSDCHIPKIASLLHGLPNLKILNIKYCLEYVNWTRQANFPFQQTMQNPVLYEPRNPELSLQLEAVDIELRSGYIGMDLVEHFFKHARSLKSMSVRYVQGEFQEGQILTRLAELRNIYGAEVKCFVRPVLYETLLRHKFPYLRSRYFAL